MHMCSQGKGSAFMVKCSPGTISLLGSKLHCVGQVTLGTVTICVLNASYKYPSEAYGVLHPLHSRGSV